MTAVASVMATNPFQYVLSGTCGHAKTAAMVARHAAYVAQHTAADTGRVEAMTISRPIWQSGAC